MAYKIDINGYIGNADFFSLDPNDYYSLSKLKADLAVMPEDETEIDVFINSGGGLVSEGFAIHDALVALPQKVNTIVLGMCGSIATVIAQAGKKGKRKMYENSEYFIHNPTWVPTGPDAMDAEELGTLQTDLENAQTRLIAFYAKVTGTSKAVLKAKMSEAISLTSDIAKALGFIDEVIKTTITNQPKYALAAMVLPNKNSNMKLEDFLAAFSGFENKVVTAISNIGKPAFKNEMKKTKDGKSVYYSGALEVGTKCFDNEEMTTPCVDGEYTIGENTYTVANGEITKVTPYVDPSASAEASKEVEEIKAQLETEKAKATDLATQVENLKAEKTAVENTAKAEVEKLKTEFTNFKSTFFTGNELKPEFANNFKTEGGNGGEEKKNNFEAIRELREKREAEIAAKIEANKKKVRVS